MSSPYLMHDGALVSRESALGKELQKWERKPDWTPEKHPFPKMLYRAQNRPDGKRSVGEVNDSMVTPSGVQPYPGAAEQWTRRCQLTVNDESEMQKAFEQGWRKTPQEALDALEAREAAVTQQTAERHYTDARMSEKAQREASEVDHSTLKQIPAIPEKRTVRKYTRKPKADSPAA